MWVASSKLDNDFNRFFFDTLARRFRQLFTFFTSFYVIPASRRRRRGGGFS
jgi:hypothetical protein